MHQRFWLTEALSREKGAKSLHDSFSGSTLDSRVRSEEHVRRRETSRRGQRRAPLEFLHVPTTATWCREIKFNGVVGRASSMLGAYTTNHGIRNVSRSLQLNKFSHLFQGKIHLSSVEFAEHSNR